MEENIYFIDKVVVVTGSSRGIGKAIATHFAKLGCKVVINSNSNMENLQNTYDELKKINPNVIMIKADVTNPSEVENMFKIVYDTFGRVDILVNNAGISRSNLINETNYDEWTKVLNTNLTSAFLVTKQALSSMIFNKSGSIINISSMWGIYGASCEIAYSTSKGGLNTFTKALAKEVGPSKIRVNAIACGFIDTNMNDIYSEEEKKDFIYNHTIIEEMGTAEDISNLVVFLASDKSRYITGQVIGVDGGFY
ncbi:MAG: 3-oxoacyl-ACP reductase FabG [Clostridia bacterium]|nr:3-oxoacyl-ACP reductase FabG [Clostridia bacterium]